MKEEPLTETAEPPALTPDLVEHRWTTDDAKYLYNLDKWGHPYFSINEKGHVAVQPMVDAETQIDIYEVIAEIRRRGIQLPVLIRFQDLLRRRVIELNESFRRAIAEFEYTNVYQGVYPIKVNQL